MPVREIPPTYPRWESDGEGAFLVTFRHRPLSDFEQVFVAGEFNGWDPKGTEMLDEDGDGVFEATVTLPRGRHLYKFTLDGEEWFADPWNPHVEAGGYGNSILYLSVNPADYPQDREPAEPEPPAIWVPEAEQASPTPRATQFRLRDDGYASVSVTGDFNGWTGQLDQMALDPSTGQWALDLRLPDPHWSAYRFVVTKDGETSTVRDPENPHVTFNGHPLDSVLFAPESGRGVVELMDESLGASGSDLEPRPVWVWLPPGYGLEPLRDYPVLHMLDGQNAFDDPINPFGHGGWHVNTAAESLIAEGRIEPFILVAVPNSPRRMWEYGPGENILQGADHAYARYLIDDVMPAVNKRFRTLTGPEHTSLMGSSMGGLISLFLAYHHPDVFGQATCLSPAFMITDPQDQSYEDLVAANGKRPIRIYLDSGTAGAREDGAPGTRAMRDRLIELGWTLGEDLVWHQEEGAEHTERAWRERVWRPLTFLYGTR
jgi:enterochelin esterase-like enzyme